MPALRPQLTVLADWLRALRLARDLDFAGLSAALADQSQLKLRPERYRRMEHPGGAHPPTLRALITLLLYYQISEAEWLALYTELRQVSRPASRARQAAQSRRRGGSMRMHRPPGTPLMKRMDETAIIADVLRSPALVRELTALHNHSGSLKTRRYLHAVLQAANRARDDPGHT